MLSAASSVLVWRWPTITEPALLLCMFGPGYCRCWAWRLGHSGILLGRAGGSYTALS